MEKEVLVAIRAKMANRARRENKGTLANRDTREKR